MRWFKSAPNGLQRCKIMLNSGPKEVKNGPRWLKIVKIQYWIYSKEKYWVQLEEKRAFDSKNTNLARFLGSNGYFFTYDVHFFFRGCEKSCKEAIERKKSGCHPRKNGHLTPKMEKIGLNNLWWANVLIREVKKNQG